MKLIAIALLFASTMAQASTCLIYAGKVSLRGRILQRTFTEQSVFKSVAKGDIDATYYFVAPHAPVCVADDAGSKEGSRTTVSEVQLVFGGRDDPYVPLKPGLGMEVECSGVLQHANSARHHSSVLLTDARCKAAPPDAEVEKVSSPMVLDSRQ